MARSTCEAYRKAQEGEGHDENDDFDDYGDIDYESNLIIQIFILYVRKRIYRGFNTSERFNLVQVSLLLVK